MGATLELFTTAVSDRTRWRVVRVTFRDGCTGVGELSDSGALPDVMHALEHLLPALSAATDAPPGGPDAVRAWADAALTQLPKTRSARTVLGGVEQALCDAAARAADLPLWQWLGGARCRPVPLYANVNRAPGGRAPADVARAALLAVKEGFTAVKCAPFDIPDDRLPLADAGLARLTAVREVIGDDVALMVDCHLRLPLDEVERILPGLHALGIGWLEDAVDIEDVAGLTRLRECTDADLVGGEFAHDVAQLLPAVEAGVIDVVMPDVKHAGGITRALAMAGRVPGVRVAPHNPSGPVGTAASAHLFLAVPHASVLEIATGEVEWRAGSLRPAEHFENGHLTLQAGSGLGVELVEHHPGTQLAWSTLL